MPRPSIAISGTRIRSGSTTGVRRLGLHDPERPSLERVAGAESEWLGGVIEGRKGDDAPDRSRFLHGQRGLISEPKWRITADDLRLRAQRGEVLGKALFQQGALAVREGADEGLARIKGGSPKRLLRQRLHFRPGPGGKREVTGPPWPFALKSSDAKTSGGRRMLPTHW